MSPRTPILPKVVYMTKRIFQSSPDVVPPGRLSSQNILSSPTLQMARPLCVGSVTVVAEWFSLRPLHFFFAGLDIVMSSLMTVFRGVRQRWEAGSSAIFLHFQGNGLGTGIVVLDMRSSVGLFFVPNHSRQTPEVEHWLHRINTRGGICSGKPSRRTRVHKRRFRGGGGRHMSQMRSPHWLLEKGRKLGG